MGALEAVGGPLVVLVAVWCPPVVVVAVWCLMAIGALPCLSLSPWVFPCSSPGALLGCWCSPVIVVAVWWPCGPPPVVQAAWCPSCSLSWLCEVPPVVVMELVPPPRSFSLLWVPPAHPRGRGCVRAWCPPVGHGCGGCFVVMVVVKGRAVNRQDTYYIRMPPHDPAN